MHAEGLPGGSVQLNFVQENLPLILVWSRTGTYAPRVKPLQIGIALILSFDVAQAATPRLKVSENQRFIVSADGKPFFYLGDTAWELFHRLNREEAVAYLEDRAKKHFTVIQA